MSLSSTPEGGFARPSGKTPPPPAPSAAYAKRQVALFTCFQRSADTCIHSARELQAQESMAAGRYRPPALRNAMDAPVENIPGGDIGGDPVVLAPPSFPQGFRRARAGTLPSNVQLAAQRYASTLPAAPVSDYESNEISNNTGINLNTGSANARPSLRHTSSMAPSVPSATIGGERNSRLRSGSLTLPSAGLSNAFGSSIFTSSWLPNNTGFPALDEMRSITSGDSITGGDEYDVHTLDYLGLDDGPSSIGGHGRPMPMPATVSELRNQAQAAIVGHQAQNPSRNRSQTISNFARARSGTTSMITAPTIEHSDDEEEIDYASGGNYGRQRMDSYEGGLYAGNSGYPAKNFRQTQHLSPNTSLLARPRAISVGILDDPNRAAAQRRAAAANAAIEQSSTSLHRKPSFSNMNDANQGILNTNAVYTAAPTSILRQPSFNLDDENNAMYAGRLTRQNSASVRFPSGDVTAGQMGNNGGRQVHLSAPMIGRGESRSVSPKMDGPSQIQTPSRSLWIGNLDPSMTGEDLAHVFAPYGAIESFRLLPEKECGFVNFVDIADAMRAKDDVLNRLSGHIGMNNNQAVRIGFGKADSAPATPPMGAQSANAGIGLGAHIQSQFTPPGQLTPNQNQANAMDSQLQSSPTRALWIGSIPSTTTPATILSVFSPYGPIESARVLTHKNCGFVNFERLDDAVRARKSLNGRDVLGSDVGAIRIGFARVPVKNSGSGDGVDEGMGAGVQGVGDLTVGATIHALRTVKGAATIPADQQVLGGSIENYRSNLLLSMIGSGTHKALGGNSNNNNGAGWTAAITEQQMVMLELSGGAPEAEADIKALGEFRPPTMYYSTIPLVAERPHNRRWDASKLRELRKRLDSGTCSVEEIDAVAADFLDGEIVDLASDWLGNTVVQKLFEKCSPGPRLAMLDRIAPHLAMIGIHKNGTWAAQKIIECATTPEEIALVSTNLRPYAPPLLLDQFGNYVVQCCLRFGSPANDFIFDAVIDRLWEVAQGRFGARSMRACLESPQITASQQRKIATAVVLNSIPLATNPNGALLLTWLLDSSGFQSRYKLLAPRFTPHLAHLCTHKLASLTVLRIVNQRIEPDASQQIVRALFNSPGDHVLTDVLGDQVNGVSVVHKILISPFIDAAERPQYLEATKRVLIDLKVTVTQAYRRLIEEVGLPLPNFQPTFAQPVPQPAKKNSGGPGAPYGMPAQGYQQPGDGLANMMQALQMQPGVGHNGQGGLQINPGYGGPGVPGPMSAGPPSGTSPATFSPTNDPFNPFARSPDMGPRGNRRGPPGGQYIPQQGQQMYNAQQGTPSLAQAGSGMMGMGQPPYGMPPNPMPPNPMPPQMYQAYMQNFVQPNSTAFHA